MEYIPIILLDDETFKKADVSLKRLHSARDDKQSGEMRLSCCCYRLLRGPHCLDNCHCKSEIPTKPLYWTVETWRYSTWSFAICWKYEQFSVIVPAYHSQFRYPGIMWHDDVIGPFTPEVVKVKCKLNFDFDHDFSTTDFGKRGFTRKWILFEIKRLIIQSHQRVWQRSPSRSGALNWGSGLSRINTFFI